MERVGFVAFIGVACYGITYELLTNVYTATGSYSGFEDDMGMFSVAVAVVISIVGAIAVNKGGSIK